MAKERASGRHSAGETREARFIDPLIWEDPDDEDAWMSGDGRRRSLIEKTIHKALDSLVGDIRSDPRMVTAGLGRRSEHEGMTVQPGAVGSSVGVVDARGANGPGDPFVTDDIRPKIAALVARGNITKEEVKDLRCNSWEWEAIYPQMDDEAFLEQLGHHLHNCMRSKRPCTTYDDSVIEVFAPELARRFRAAMDVVARLETEIGIFQSRVRTVVQRRVPPAPSSSQSVLPSSSIKSSITSNGRFFIRILYMGILNEKLESAIDLSEKDEFAEIRKMFDHAIVTIDSAVWDVPAGIDFVTTSAEEACRRLACEGRRSRVRYRESMGNEAGTIWCPSCWMGGGRKKAMERCGIGRLGSRFGSQS